VRQQDELRRRLVVVELREEGAQHFFRRERLLRAREIGAVAPVLPGAEEEHLDTGVAALLVDREHVGLFHCARIDALLRLDRRQCGEAVAVERGGLEFEFVRRLLHFGRELLLHRMAAAGQEFGRLAHQLGIAGEIDLAGAGAGAAPDLVEQAGPRAAFEEAVGAGADQERALQRRDGAVDRAGRGKRTEIAPGPRLRAAMFQDLRRPMVSGDQDIGKRFVVAQLHVEARPELLDQIGFEQQRLCLRRRRDDLDIHGRRDHAQDARRQWRVGACVGGQPLADVLRLADIEHVAGGVEHAVDAGRGRGQQHRILDRGMADRERTLGNGVAEFLGNLRQQSLVVLVGRRHGRIEVARDQSQIMRRRRFLRQDSRIRLAPRLFGGGRFRMLGRIVVHGMNLSAGSWRRQHRRRPAGCAP
jgi:hypothetical protein